MRLRRARSVSTSEHSASSAICSTFAGKREVSQRAENSRLSLAEIFNKIAEDKLEGIISFGAGPKIGDRVGRR